MNKTNSISEWISTEFLANNPNHIYTFICDCKDCSAKNWVKVRTAQIPAIAEKAGFKDSMNQEQLRQLAHLIVQRNG